MESETSDKLYDYDRYYKFVKPSVEMYEQAIREGKKPTEKELNFIRYCERIMAREIKYDNLPFEENIKFIQGHEKLKEFYFHDSKALWFEHNDKYAKLKLKFENIIATFLFEEILEIQIYRDDPVKEWIYDFKCYPIFENPKDGVVFDIASYIITCLKISVEKIEKI